MRAPFIALCACLAASPAIAEEVDHDALLDRALSQSILPGFSELAERTAVLSKTATAVCDGSDDLAALRTAYAQTYAAWMAVDAFRFGPVEERSAALQINFWPDKKNFVGRALKGLEAATPVQLADPTFIEGQSAAAQGLPAVERLIVGDMPCPLTPAIAAHLSTMAQALQNDWTNEDGWAALMRASGETNPVYLSGAETSAELYKALQFGLQTLSDARLGRPLGSFDAPRPKRAEAWRSELSRANVIAQFEASRVLYQSTFAPLLADEDLESDWRAAAVALGRMPKLLTEGVSQPGTRFKIEAAQNRIDDLRAALGETLAPHLGIAIGFNSADGD